MGTCYSQTTISSPSTFRTTKSNVVEGPDLTTHSEHFSNQHISIDVCSMKGRRQTMEDAHNVVMDLNAKAVTPLTTLPVPSSFSAASPVSFMGVFDGHRGNAASQFLSSNLGRSLTDACASGVPLTDELVSDVVRSLDEQFCRDRSVRNHGSTALFCLAQKSHMDTPCKPSTNEPLPELPLPPLPPPTPKGTCFPLDITVANIGDSRALLLRPDGGCIPVSRDHSPLIPTERKRIEEAGGHVTSGRVDGELMMSRAFGDYWLKNNPDLAWNKQQLISEPEFHHFTLQPGELLLISTDGLFEGMSHKQVRDFIWTAYDQQPHHAKDINSILKQLFNASLNARSGDNHTAMLISCATPAARKSLRLRPTGPNSALALCVPSPTASPLPSPLLTPSSVVSTLDASKRKLSTVTTATNSTSASPEIQTRHSLPPNNIQVPSMMTDSLALTLVSRESVSQSVMQPSATCTPSPSPSIFDSSLHSRGPSTASHSRTPSLDVHV